MTKINHKIRLYRCTDDIMLLEANVMCISYIQDEALFIAFDAFTFTPNFKDLLNAAIEAARSFISDELIVDQQMGKTEDVKIAVKNIEPLYNDLKYFVRKAFPGSKNIWNEFGFKDYRFAVNSVPRMLSLLDLIATAARRYSAELIAVGYTQLQINAIQSLHDTLMQESTEQETFKKQRCTSTGNRIDLMNAAYSMLVQINSASKIIFRGNYPKLREYRLPRPHHKVKKQNGKSAPEPNNYEV